MNFNFLLSHSNSALKSLKKLDENIHLKNTKLENTFVDKFIHELQYSIFKADCTSKLKNLSKDTKLEINEIEETYVQCYFDGQPYNITKDTINFNSRKEDYFCLQLQKDGLYHFVPQ